jgi:hypothetical protein
MPAGFEPSYMPIIVEQSEVEHILHNFILNNDLQIPLITEEIKRHSSIYYNRSIGHENSYVTELSKPLDVRRRVKRQWPSDLRTRERKRDRRTHNIMHSRYRRIIIG